MKEKFMKADYPLRFVTGINYSFVTGVNSLFPLKDKNDYKLFCYLQWGLFLCFKLH